MSKVVLKKEIKDLFFKKRWNVKSFADYTGMSRNSVTSILKLEKVNKTTLAAFALHLELPDIESATDSNYL